MRCIMYRTKPLNNINQPKSSKVRGAKPSVRRPSHVLTRSPTFTPQSQLPVATNNGVHHPTLIHPGQRTTNTMSDSSQRPSSSSILTSLISIHVTSLRILMSNPKPFLSLYLLTTLPISFLTLTLSASSHSLQAQIYHLEALSLHPSLTRFEARHLWQESRSSAVSLLRFKSIFLIPILPLSLVSSITIINSALQGYNGKRIKFSTALTLVNANWKRPLATGLVVYSLRLSISAVLRILAGFGSGFFVGLVGGCFEVYLMAVLGVAVLVSVVEEGEVGWGAVVSGYRVMKGRRVVGWVVTGVVLAMASLVGWKMEEGNGVRDVVKEYEPKREVVRVVMVKFGSGLGLVFALGFVVLWSYVVTAVYYCECRKRNNSVGLGGKSGDGNGSSEDEEMMMLPSVVGPISVQPTLSR